ncbi:hypothetical protein BC831DRAFT_457879 [Entophlyctis helioformis]|nr:hypothetical protein BC831DRAFT_457879 [Entophlyctis helioformis]
MPYLSGPADRTRRTLPTVCASEDDGLVTRGATANVAVLRFDDFGLPVCILVPSSASSYSLHGVGEGCVSARTDACVPSIPRPFEVAMLMREPGREPNVLAATGVAGMPTDSTAADASMTAVDGMVTDAADRGWVATALAAFGIIDARAASCWGCSCSAMSLCVQTSVPRAQMPAIGPLLTAAPSDRAVCGRDAALGRPS